MRITSTALLLLLLAYAPAQAQWRIPQHVMGTGGQEVSSTNWSVRGTVGQVSTGTLNHLQKQLHLGYWYNPYSIATGVEMPEAARFPFALGQATPNPFNPRTVIPFSLPRRAHVQLRVIDVRGRLVTTLVDEEMPAGDHLAEFTPRNLASGLYFAQLVSDGRVHTRKITLLK